MKTYVVLHKKVGETPLACLEEYKSQHERLWCVPMAYAGRLDPMAEGKLLVLLGDECKVQEKYHKLDKEYTFEVLFGVHSDTADVLGRLDTCEVPKITTRAIKNVAKKMVGRVELPYPHFSSKTVDGKPLHTWKLEGRIDEIVIPTKQSTLYSLTLKCLRQESAQSVFVYATEKIETIPKVTEERKALGNDFRRSDIRKDWQKFMDEHNADTRFYIATFTCVCSSGTYMRTLAELIANELHACGLAYSIKRTKIGIYQKLPFGLGFWRKSYK
ncbi:MAG: tRNA pseudouridine synthase tRNA pseudouridine55 synthase [Candidatus Parcubacteria bacterium]|jgi:tRNA pseudouridine(55) synthase